MGTPALLLDHGVVLRNIGTMRERMAMLKVALRPHLKTAKSAKVAALATADQSAGITVSTLKEAEYFLEHGYRDILYAVSIIPAKLDDVAALEAKGARITILTDNVSVAWAIIERARLSHTRFRVMIEVDTGGRRAGVLPESKELIGIGHLLDQASQVELAGVLTHAGHAYHCRTVAEIKAIARQERDGIVLAAQRLRSAGLPCPIVSAGSTPTAVYAEDLHGVTEMRPGVYVFYDLDQLALGTCRREDLALSVLASVIGHNEHAGHLLIDAGALALSKDISASEFRPEVGFGEVCDVWTLKPFPGLFIRAVHQEHGIVPIFERVWFERLPVGSKVRILPNHACLTAAAYHNYQVIENGLVIDTWDRINGW
jgi:D-serine deaminase-like pyridoxal phosphate-dependent protein